MDFDPHTQIKEVSIREDGTLVERVASAPAGYVFQATSPQQMLDEQWAAVRAERDRRLAATDWTLLRAMEQGQPVPTAWSTYRQALRDITLQPDPFAIDWPAPPA